MPLSDMERPSHQLPVKRSTPQAVTAAQLAEKLGLSRSTVSIVLRGDAERRKISTSTVKRVLEAAKKYNYVPNFLAQSLRRQKSGIISVLVVNFSMNWCEELMTGLYEVLEAKHYTPFVAAHRASPERQQRELEASLRRRDDAVILQPIPGEEETYRHVIDAGLNLLFLGDYPASMPDSNYVAWDSGDGARAAVEHLIRLGRKRIGYVGVEYPLKMHIERFQNYERALREASLPVDPRFIVNGPTQFASETTFEEYLDKQFDCMFARDLKREERPDALFMMNDGIALPAIPLLEKRGLRIPQDVALVGMGNLALTGHSGIGLTTIHEPVAELGAEAARAAIELIDGTDAGPIHGIIPGSKLLARRTTLG